MFDEKDIPANLPTGAATSPNVVEVPQRGVGDQPAPTLTMSEKPESFVTSKPLATGNPPPAPVEDMFDAVDVPVAQASPTSEVDPALATRKGIVLKMILMIVVAVILLAAITWGAFAILGTSESDLPAPAGINPTPTTSTTPGQNPTGSIDPIPDPQPIDVSPPDPQPVVEPDGDGDGLTDAEEARYGTAIHKPDTDNDGLFDREEVMVYRTNPLSADTDGDGYLDGAEVSGGYNPNGPGRLTELPTSKD